MRALVKKAVPEVLVIHSERWNREYAEGIGTGHWGHPEIRERLEAETEGRCVYCEARVRHVAWEHVEHILPKSKFPLLSHEWANLTAACPVCNVNKGDYHHEHEPLLNPYIHDPAEHLVWLGPTVWCAGGSEIGYRSIKKLGLGRGQLIKDRGLRIERVLDLVRQWQFSSDGMREALHQAIVLDWQEGEYPSAVKAALEAMGFPVEDLT